MTYNDDFDRQAKDLNAAERGAGADPALHPGAQALQDKAAIDAGRGHDKVAGMDLATTPLGTDAEAGGDVSDVGPPPPAVEGGAGRDPNRANAVRPPMPWVWVVLAILAALVLGAALLTGLT